MTSRRSAGAPLSRRTFSRLTGLGLVGALLPAATQAQATPAAPPVPVTIPATPVGQQLIWVLQIVNDADPLPTADELAAHFSADFLMALPPDQLLATFTALTNAMAPATIGRFEGAVTADHAVALLATPSESWRVTIGVLATPDHQINDLFFEPAPLIAPLAKPPTTWQAFAKQLATFAPRAAVSAAEIVNGQCRPLFEQNATAELAVASSFKLYVLGELAAQVAAGKASWDEEWVIRQEWQSLPSGTMQDDPPGTMHTLRQYAENMISLSDNTAADHLIHRLGREAIEANLAKMGHSKPALDIPLLTTREFFLLKSALPAAVVDQYITATPAQRRQQLASIVDSASIKPAWSAVWDSPIHIDTIEWFAATHDLCQAMSSLFQRASEPSRAPVRDILSINPDQPIDPRRWTYVGFKGGDETGVMARTWLLQRNDGRWFILSTILNDPEHHIDSIAATQLLMAGIDLLAKTR